MTIVSVGDLARNLMLQRTTALVRRDLDNATQAVTSGLHPDITKATRGDFNLLSSIDISLARIGSWQANASLLQMRLSVQQSALQGVDSLADEVANDLLVAAGAHSHAGLVAAGMKAEAAFFSAVNMVNSRADGIYAFSGQNTDRPPLVPAQTILAQIETLTTGLVFIQDIRATVLDWFDDPAGFAAFAYEGGDARMPVSISDADSVTAGITAIEPGLRDTLAGLALAALFGRGIPAGPMETRMLMAKATGEVLLEAKVARVDVAAGIGAAENRVQQAQTRLGAEASGLQQVRASVVAADPYESALRLQETQSRLEAIYMVTARLSRLSLSEYLR